VLSLDEIRHVVTALENMRRHTDGAVAGYFAGQLAACAASDGMRGPKETLPLVLAIIAAVEHAAREAKPAVRSRLLSVGAYGAEFAGWLYRDSAVPHAAGYWHDRAAEWAQVAGDRAFQGYVLLRRSQLAWDDRDARRMLMLAQAVQAGHWDLPPRVRAEAAQQEARGHAMLGADMGLIEGKLDEARALLADEPSARTAAGAPLAGHYGAPLLAMQTALCYSEAGQPARAVEIYQEWLTTQVFSRRDYAYFRALAAASLAAVGRPDDAAAAGREALATAAAVGSLRTLRELSRLLERLRPWPARPAVLAFRDELAATLSWGR
jgi:tetratricopeptide (TPR) repeat protein